MLTCLMMYPCLIISHCFSLSIGWMWSFCSPHFLLTFDFELTSQSLLLVVQTLDVVVLLTPLPGHGLQAVGLLCAPAMGKLAV